MAAQVRGTPREKSMAFEWLRAIATNAASPVRDARLAAIVMQELVDLNTVIDLVAHLRRQRVFSEKTFGPGTRTNGLIAHIQKELAEIAADPLDLYEWIDVVILALDGAWRAGHSPEEIAAALIAKQRKNEAREWPDWRTFSEGEPIEAPARSPTSAELHRTLEARLPNPQWRILAALIRAYPNAIPRDEVARQADASPTSSGFQNNLGALRSLGFIDYPARGFVAALPVLFLERG